MPYLRLILPVLVFLLAAHGAYVYAPWLYLPGSSADASKNLFTFAWYSAHNASWFNFEGMAWPYGEHIFYTDQTPLLSMVWRPIVRLFGLEAWSAPLLISLIHLSWMLTPLPLFKLLRHFNVREGIAIAGAVAYTLLAPQTLRAEGHFALGFTLAIPLVWWLAVRAVRNGFTLRSLVLLGSVNLIWLLTHAYLGMISIAFTALFFGALWITRPRKWRPVGAALLVALPPVLLFLLVLGLSDWHTCRTENPFGYCSFTSSVEALFLPQLGPHTVVAGVMDRVENWEGYAYIGASAVLMLFSFFFWGPFKRRELVSNEARLLVASLLAALALFLLAAGMPFCLVGEYTLNRFPYIKAFRGIGRFAWPMYFVLTLLAVYLLDVVTRNAAKPVASSLAVAFFFIVIGEATFVHHALREKRTAIAHPFTLPDAAMQQALDAVGEDQAAAILPLPFFHVGSEIYGRKPIEGMELGAQSFAFHSRLPLIAAHFTRTSITETRDLMQLLGPAGYDKSLAPFLRPFNGVLLYAFPDALRPYSDEWWLWQAGEERYEGAQFALRYLPMETLLHPPGQGEKQGAELIEYRLDTLTSACDAYTMLYDATPDSSWVGSHFEANVWFKTSDDCAGVQKNLYGFLVAQRNDDGKNTWMHYVTPKQSFRHDGEWVEATVVFTLDSLPDCVQVFVQGEPGCDEPLLLRDFSLYRLDGQSYR